MSPHTSTRHKGREALFHGRGMVVLMAFTTIPAKTVGTVGTNTRDQAMVRVTRWLRVGTE